MVVLEFADGLVKIDVLVAWGDAVVANVQLNIVTVAQLSCHMVVEILAYMPQVEYADVLLAVGIGACKVPAGFAVYMEPVVKHTELLLLAVACEKFEVQG